jgi:endonuclease/exonuclease/phosphatase family metal-dependent hydrolase
MKVKIASYNISGGFYNSDDKTEYLDKERAENVDDKMLEQIIETINDKDIDVICFQEIITTERIKYIQSICNRTNLKYYEFYELSECNIVKDTNCGIAVLSKYPMKIVQREFFPNPGLTKTTSSGKTYYLYDKGYMIVSLNVNNKEISLLTHHGFPYGVFNSTAEENMEVFKFFDDAIERYNPDIITGDFNAENFMPLMKKTDDKYFRTIDNITTVEGKKLDDICLRKNNKYSSEVLRLLSDHYMIITVVDLI